MSPGDEALEELINLGERKACERVYHRDQKYSFKKGKNACIIK